MTTRGTHHNLHARRQVAALMLLGGTLVVAALLTAPLQASAAETRLPVQEVEAAAFDYMPYVLGPSAAPG